MKDNRAFVVSDSISEDIYKTGYDHGYQKGRADKYQEITSECMLLTEQQVAEIKADAIEYVLDAIEHCVTQKDCVDIIKQLKGQTNE